MTATEPTCVEDVIISPNTAREPICVEDGTISNNAATETICVEGAIISPHTNKPVSAIAGSGNSPVFWCGICSLALQHPITALQHMTGRSHARARVKQSSKRSANEDGISAAPGGEPMKKKIREQMTEKVKTTCEDCKMEFFSEASSADHFNGRKHRSMIAKKLGQNSSQGQGKGQGGGGQASGGGGTGQRATGWTDRGMGKGGRGGNFTTDGVPIDNSSPNFLPVEGQPRALPGGRDGGLLRSHLLNAKAKRGQSNVANTSFSNHKLPMGNINTSTFNNTNSQHSEAGINHRNFEANINYTSVIDRSMCDNRNQSYDDPSRKMLHNKIDSSHVNMKMVQGGNCGTNQNNGASFSDQTTFRDDAVRTFNNQANPISNMENSKLYDNTVPPPNSGYTWQKPSDYVPKSAPGEYSNVAPPSNEYNYDNSSKTQGYGENVSFNNDYQSSNYSYSTSGNYSQSSTYSYSPSGNYSQSSTYSYSPSGNYSQSSTYSYSSSGNYSQSSTYSYSPSGNYSQSSNYSYSPSGNYSQHISY